MLNEYTSEVESMVLESFDEETIKEIVDQVRKEEPNRVFKRTYKTTYTGLPTYEPVLVRSKPIFHITEFFRTLFK